MDLLKAKEIRKSGDGTCKFLFELSDGNKVETVYMQHPYGGSVCVSSQAGCSMGCRFCASGLLKKVRDLTDKELLGQVLSVQDWLEKQPEERPAITHAVVMGTGEPFDNYDQVLSFCGQITDPRYLEQYFKVNTLEDAACTGFSALAPRHITISTCGIVPKILEYARSGKSYRLAISLHAPDDALRDRLMPVNKKYPTGELIAAAGKYCRSTNKRITFEYILLQDVNDSAEQAEKLAQLLSGEERFYVNLIPYNPVGEFGFRGSEKEQALLFYDVLMKNGIRATLRKERGGDIEAACGQLRLNSVSLFEERRSDSGLQPLQPGSDRR